jgi:hypothetical protein
VRLARTAPGGFQALEFQTFLQFADFLVKFLNAHAVVLCKGAEFANFGVMAGHKCFRLTGAQKALMFFFRMPPGCRECSRSLGLESSLNALDLKIYHALKVTNYPATLYHRAVYPVWQALFGYFCRNYQRALSSPTVRVIES